MLGKILNGLVGPVQLHTANNFRIQTISLSIANEHFTWKYSRSVETVT